MRLLLLAPCAAALLSGCISGGPFPSLAPRPDERLATFTALAIIIVTTLMAVVGPLLVG